MPKEPVNIEAENEYELAPADKDRLTITAGDVVLFKLFSEYRLLRLEHLEVLTGRSYRRLHRRIFRLVQFGYLLPIVLPQQKHIYRLGKKALRVLVEQGSADHEALVERSRLHELTEFFLKHEMMIVDL